ncbi:MAG: GspE/PulE family protein [Candidatus Saccharimonadaceae bacterium]|nr:GspE/PulE family protein [Candidatus Saccharimonadaceae bacterium]
MEKLLIRSGVATAEQVDALKEEASRLKHSLQDLATQNDIIDEKTLTKAFSEYAQIPYIELNPSNIPSDVLNKIPERIARQYNAILFKVDEDGTCHMAMDDPDDVQAIDFLEKEFGTNTKIYITPHSNIIEALEAYRSDVDQELNEVIDIQRADEIEGSENVSEQEVSEDSPIAQTVNLLLEYAIRQHASDIHIEPREGFVEVRYRIDGVLKEVNRLPRNVLNALVSRIKILSNLKIDERRVPQDGRFKIKVGSKQYALRVSTIPVSDGEKTVLRILDESNQALALEELGLWGKSRETFRSSLIEANGMILITGPTGSGKSTSLFSALTILNTTAVNISTIEDPVEYKIPGVNQTQTNPQAGMTFANGLRALLRQDPNIIMIGEIRDSETADLAVQAALTGHLVFSTLHTNDAATCLPRLLDMKIEPFLIASIVRVVVGQRLVRKLNHETRISYVPSEKEKQTIIKMFNLEPGQDFSYIHELEKQAAAEGVGGDTPLSTDENGIKTMWKNNPEDNNSGSLNGYKGRIGIFEALNNSVPMQNLIMANANSTQLKTLAISEGMITMQVDGLIKALRGETTVEEVMRVTKE